MNRYGAKRSSSFGPYSSPFGEGLKIRRSGGILTAGHSPFKARQIRNPKSEIRNKFKIRRLQASKRREAAWFCDSDFGPSGLFRISSCHPPQYCYGGRVGFRILGKV